LSRTSWKEALKRTDGKGWDESIASMKVRCRAGEVSLPSQDVLFIVAVEREEIDRRFLEILKRSGIGLGTTLLLSVLGVWLIVWRAMRPLRNLTEEVAGITPSSIRPVTIPDDPELSLLAVRLNHSLSAVARSLEREKQFSSDVAHELFTPIGGLRAVLDVALLQPRPVEEMRETAEQCKTMVAEIEDLVRALLELGRFEAGTSKVTWQEIDLPEALDVAWCREESVAQGRRIHYENRVDASVRIEAIPHCLDIILKNLLSNVARHTPSGGKAWVECEEAGHDLLLRVANENKDLPPGFREQAFERFWRGDLARTKKSRSEARQSIGLGLPLARSAAVAMGAELEIEIAPDSVVCFVLRLKRIGTTTTASRTR
jgi:two-component system, OmpR family, heavy metal sensor histidine kinase CusS